MSIVTRQNLIRLNVRTDHNFMLLEVQGVPFVASFLNRK